MHYLTHATYKTNVFSPRWSHRESFVTEPFNLNVAACLDGDSFSKPHVAMTLLCVTLTCTGGGTCVNT